MWLVLSKVCAFLAAGSIAARILRLIVLARGGDAAPAGASRFLTADRLLRWAFYLFMAMALGAFVLHTRQR